MPRIQHPEIRAKLNVETPRNIATVAPELYVNFSISGATAALSGIHPQAECKLKSQWVMQQDDYIRAIKDVVGSVAAEALKLQPGSTVSIDGTDWNVARVPRETGSNDDYEVFLLLAGLQNMFDKQGTLSSIQARALCNACQYPKAAVAATVTDGNQVTKNADLLTAYRKTLNRQ